MPYLKVPVAFWGDKELREYLVRLASSLGINNDPDSFAYCADNLITFIHHAGFRKDETFAAAMLKYAVDPIEVQSAWRKHIVCWAIRSCLDRDGDFVEAGTADGYTALVALECVPAARDRTFWLYDTFDTDTGRVDPEDRPALPFEKIVDRFKGFTNVKFLGGTLPDILDESVHPEQIAFLHLDVGDAKIEADIMRRLLPRLSGGAIIIANSYGLLGIPYGEIKPALDLVASKHGLSFAELPTGQGLLVNR